jgi:hypothetical protein
VTLRKAWIGLLFVLAIAGCADQGAGLSSTTSQADPGTSQTTPESTSVPGEVTTTTEAGSTPTTSGRPPAPDFTLQLGDGGSYTLSEGSKPVYLVFWAEW